MNKLKWSIKRDFVIFAELIINSFTITKCSKFRGMWAKAASQFHLSQRREVNNFASDLTHKRNLPSWGRHPPSRPLSVFFLVRTEGGLRKALCGGAKAVQRPVARCVAQKISSARCGSNAISLLRLSQPLLFLLVNVVGHQDDAPEIEPFCIFYEIRTTRDRELLAGFVIF